MSVATAADAAVIFGDPVLVLLLLSRNLLRIKWRTLFVLYILRFIVNFSVIKQNKNVAAFFFVVAVVENLIFF